MISRIFGRNQDDIEIPSQPAVLKTIVEQMPLRSEARFSQAGGFIPIFPHDHRNLQPSSDQQRLIPEILRGSSRIDQQNPTRPPPVAARKNVELHSTRFQQFAEKENKRRFSRASRGKIPHADHRALQSPRPQHAAIIERVAHSADAAVEG